MNSSGLEGQIIYNHRNSLPMGFVLQNWDLML